MAVENNEELELFKMICIDDDSSSESDVYFGLFDKIPPPPKQPPVAEKFINFEKYIEEECENKIKVLDRTTFHRIKRPIIIGFNHFREKCTHLTKWLDRMYQLALKYGDRIEFIAADLMDMDVMYPHQNPIIFFCNLVRPEHESLRVYAIDEKRRIHEHFDAYQTIENLSELCENLLSEKLYLSQPIPEKNDTFVKICVHQNYDELITNSSKDILLIVGMKDYQVSEEREPNYEQIAKDLQNSNVDIVYINGIENYVPFEFRIFCYPTLLFIPSDDKENFIHYSKGMRMDEPLMEFIKLNIGPKGKCFRENEFATLRYKPFSLPNDVELNFDEFGKYINENFPNSMKILPNSSTLPKIRRHALIFFCNFELKGIRFYLKTLEEIHQVAERNCFCGMDYIVADIKNMNLVYPKWFCKEYEELSQKEKCEERTKIVAIDMQNRKYEADPAHLQTAASIFYYTYGLTRSDFYYSQPLTKTNTAELVVSCVSRNILQFIEKSKKDIFLTIYWPNYVMSSKILKVVEEIAYDVKKMGVKMLKMDAKFNYVPAEYSYKTYPIHFYIPKRNRDEYTRSYKSSSQSKEDILEFIRTNISTSA